MGQEKILSFGSPCYYHDGSARMHISPDLAQIRRHKVTIDVIIILLPGKAVCAHMFQGD
jgi:hypothetical protein